MNKKIKAVLRSLINPYGREMVFGDLIAPIVFRKNNVALLLDGGHKECYLLQPSVEMFHSNYLFLSELLGVMNILEKEASVVLLEDSVEYDLDLFYEGKEDFKETQLPGTYELSKNSSFTYTYQGVCYIDGRLTGTKIPNSLYKNLSRLLRSRVYPTESLVRFIRQGFMTDSQYDTMRALWLNRVAILVAILLGIVPLIHSYRQSSVHPNNYSTRIESPIDTLNKIEPK